MNTILGKPLCAISICRAGTSASWLLSAIECTSLTAKTAERWPPLAHSASCRNMISTFRTKGPALAVSKGLDRDRAADESGYQVSIFNRIGARPMTLAEKQRLYLRNGQIYTVSEGPK